MERQIESKTCCVTGHREIPADKLEYVKQELRREILQAIEDGYTHFLSGFAEGVDLLFAEIVAELKKNGSALFLEAVIPYRNRMKTKDKLFHQLIPECDGIVVVNEKYSRDCYIELNRFMINPSQRVIAVYDGREKGGTLFTMRYAHTQEKDIRAISI